MDDARVQYESALEVARDALAAYRAEPTGANFRIWRDSEEVAIKWCRAQRLGSGEDRTDEQLAEILSG
jgi:hypothetical protein